MVDLLTGRWRGVKYVNAGGVTVEYDENSGPLYRFHDDRTVDYSYKTNGEWGITEHFKLVVEYGKMKIEGDVIPKFVKSVTEIELVIVAGLNQADFTYYLRRI